MGQSLEGYKTTPGRMKLIDGINNSTIIDDSYNSSPVALYEALNVLDAVNAPGKKIAVLGDMMELGSFAADEHKKAGEKVAAIADMLVTVCVRARYFAEGARKGGMEKKNILQFDDSQIAGQKLAGKLGHGDIVLVKGSQSVRMERVVEEIMEHPEEKKELLVRQEKEWQKM
jgi:UDP-N-acetylmuramyl pentapeptide synthase